MSTACLTVNNLTLAYEPHAPLFRNISFSVEPGDLVSILGPNGSGKTSLIRNIIKPTRFITGTLTLHVKPEELSYLPQIQNDRLHFPVALGEILEKTSPEKTLSALDPVLVHSGMLAKNWNHASGGEKKRVLLQRCLLTRPKLLILDEPLNHLDRVAREVMRAAILNYVRHGGSALVVTHEPIHSDSGPSKVVEL